MLREGSENDWRKQAKGGNTNLQWQSVSDLETKILRCFGSKLTTSNTVLQNLVEGLSSVFPSLPSYWAVEASASGSKAYGLYLTPVCHLWRTLYPCFEVIGWGHTSTCHVCWKFGGLLFCTGSLLNMDIKAVKLPSPHSRFQHLPIWISQSPLKHFCHAFGLINWCWGGRGGWC